MALTGPKLSFYWKFVERSQTVYARKPKNIFELEDFWKKMVGGGVGDPKARVKN